MCTTKILALMMTALRCVWILDRAMHCVKRLGIEDAGMQYTERQAVSENSSAKFTNRSLIAHYSPTQTSAFISSQVWREVKNNSEKKGEGSRLTHSNKLDWKERRCYSDC